MGYVGKVQDTAGNTHLVGSTLYGTCSTSVGTAAKVVTCPNFTELVEGVTIHVKFTYSNTAPNATLNVNSTGAKDLCSYGTTRVGLTEGLSWKPGAVVSLTYDGTSWVMNDYIPDTWVNTDTKVTQTATTENSDYPILFKNSANQTDETNQVRFGNTSGKTPKINPSTGNVSAPSFNGHALAAASDKGVDTSLGSGATNDNVPTSAAVVSYVASAVSGGTAFQGSLVQTDSGSSAVKWTQAELEASSYVKGWYWVCEEAGTYAGNVMEVGDMLFAVLDKGSSYSASDFTAVQNNIETLTTTEVSTLWANAVAVS